MEAIITKNLTKRFKDLVAVDNVCLGVGEGEIFGLLGPNGAGKTTLISMLSTLLKPTSGDGWVWGQNIRKDQDRVRRAIGIVFQDPSLDDELTTYENLEFHGRLYGVAREVRRKRIKDLLTLMELADRERAMVKTFSGGMKRRLEIARGLLHYPKVLFLDEPTLGLDPQTRRRIWEYIRNLNEVEKVTIVLTTHYMEEADYLCGRIAIIDHGRIIALDLSQNLKNIVGGDVISLLVLHPQEVAKLLSPFPWIKQVKIHDGVLDLSVEKGEEKIPKIMKIIGGNGLEVRSISLHKPTLEDVFLHFTGKTIREEEGSFTETMRMRMRAWRKR